MLQTNQVSTNNLCLSGGTALNCPSNTNIYLESPFKNVFVEPCCDDSGIAVGAALALYHSILGNPREISTDAQTPFLGIHYSGGSVLKALDSAEGISYEKCESPGESAAYELADNKIIAWYQGRSEIGPRALGARSILAHPGLAENWDRVNELKRREKWRPFAPAVLETRVHDWFSGVPCPSPYMLFNAHVISKDIPAVTHVDKTARVQTVNESNGEYYSLIRKFEELTGIPVVLNTSFNGPGEPVVETVEQAIGLLLSTDIDTLYVDKFVVRRAC